MKKKTHTGNKLKNKSALIGMIAIILSLAITVGLFMATTVKANDTVTIAAAKTNIAQGKQITASDIEMKTVSRYNLPTNVIENQEAVLNKYAALQMKAGDYIFTNKISNSALGTDTQLADLPDGQLALSFTVKTQAAGVANKLQAGDIIRVYSYDQSGGVQEHQELSYVKILSASDSTGAEVNESTEGTGTVYSTVTVSATTAQAKKLILLENTTTISVSFLTRNAETAAQLLQKQAELLA